MAQRGFTNRVNINLVLDEGELTIPLFLADLAKGNAQKVYRADKNEYALLQNTPLPRWDLINIKHYASLMIQHSRGCPFNKAPIKGSEHWVLEPQAPIAESSAKEST